MQHKKFSTQTKTNMPSALSDRYNRKKGNLGYYRNRYVKRENTHTETQYNRHTNQRDFNTGSDAPPSLDRDHDGEKTKRLGRHKFFFTKKIFRSLDLTDSSHLVWMNLKTQSRANSRKFMTKKSCRPRK